MKRQIGAVTVPGRYYLNLSTWEVVRTNENTSLFPGKGKVKYLSMPAPLLLVAAPLAGLAFYILLPVVTIVAFPSFLGYKVGLWAWKRMRRAIQPVTIGWSPGRAYLVRKRRSPSDKGKTEETEEHLKKLEKDIAERRHNGEE